MKPLYTDSPGNAARGRKSRVLSVRVSDAEWRSLHELSRQHGVDLSALLRQGLRQLLPPAMP